MHAGNLSTSQRLQRVFRALEKAKEPLSTLDLSEQTGVLAVSTTISELRARGLRIACWRVETRDKKGRYRPLWVYTLLRRK